MTCYQRSALVANTLLPPLPTSKPAKCGTACKDDDLGRDTIIVCLIVRFDIAAKVRGFLRDILLIQFMDSLIGSGS